MPEPLDLKLLLLFSSFLNRKSLFLLKSWWQVIYHLNGKRKKQIVRREFKITGALIFSLVQMRSPNTLNRCRNSGVILIVLQGQFYKWAFSNIDPLLPLIEKLFCQIIATSTFPISINTGMTPASHPDVLRLVTLLRCLGHGSWNVVASAFLRAFHGPWRSNVWMSERSKAENKGKLAKKTPKDWAAKWAGRVWVSFIYWGREPKTNESRSGRVREEEGS